MKVIALNGSPRKESNTAIALGLMADELKASGIDTEIITVGDVHGCIGCGYCSKSENNHCVFKDDALNDTSDKMRAADGIILASPTYYAGISGNMKSFLDRLFYSSTRYFRYKVGTAITTVRRAGGVDVIHQLNNYFTLAEMVLAPSQYWQMVYGAKPGEILNDAEGIQTIKENAHAMGWLIKSLAAARSTVPYPEKPARAWTNFIR